MRNMTDIQEITGNSKPITDGETEPTLLDLRKQLDHMDEGLHELRQMLATVMEYIGDVAADTGHTAAFIRLHEPTLDRALKLFDNPVSKWRAAQMAKHQAAGDGT